MKASYLKPLLPLRDIVIFPSMVVPLFVGREKSIKALQEVMKTDKSIVLVTQKNPEVDDPTNLPIAISGRFIGRRFAVDIGGFFFKEMQGLPIPLINFTYHIR